MKLSKSNESYIKMKTVNLLQKVIKPWCNEGIVSNLEKEEILLLVRRRAKYGDVRPREPLKLLDRKQVAEKLNLSLSSFKALEKNGKIPLKQKKMGGAIRYNSHQLEDFMESSDDIVDEDLSKLKV